jgi:hypothetical protein
MSYYSKIEQETHYNYSPQENYWRIDSTYPPHIRKLLEVAEITNKEVDEQGRIISVMGVVNKNQVRLFKPEK